MKKFAQYILFAFLLINISSIEAAAVSHAATSCSNSDIQTQIDAAADGDVVSVPACSSIFWNGNVSIPNSKGITLQGAGADKTIITTGGYGIILQTSPSNKPVRITGFTFIQSNASRVLTITGTAQNWRIDNNTFDANNVRAAYQIRIGNQSANTDAFTYGVIDSNRFINLNWATSIFVEWPRGPKDPVAAGDWIWTQSAQRGTAQAVYIENNLFEGGMGPASQAIDARWGAKYVFRYNTVKNPWISTHSGCSNGGRDPIWVEIYKNNFIDDSNNFGGSQIEMRSVSGIIWDNTSSITLAKYTISIDHERSYRNDCDIKNSPYNALCDGSRAWDENSGLHGYRCLGQPGWGPPQGSNMNASSFSGLFVWKNTNNGNAVELYIANNNLYTAEHLQYGRDLFRSSDMIIGTVAERPLTCSAGPPRDVYVSIDENPIGAVIYVCSGTNVWTKHYEPYC